eukprot:TRINITY_DN747_c0_g2_i7.p1 TRINITY_DN747_c0_g2~~TRINITY_DN747_c0_g2_i7.p1  ORF type:complete len:817 (+),score=196.15 TRINITY_DN747_c0_g2_i7:1275-3725(+)
MGCQFNIPIFAMILTATLVSTASSMGGGLILYFQGLESLEDSMLMTSAGELQSLRETIRNKLSNVEEGIGRVRRFIFSAERFRPGMPSSEWADVMRAFGFAQVGGSDSSFYSTGVWLVPHDWAVVKGFGVVTHENSHEIVATGPRDMAFAEFHDQLPENHTVLGPDGQLSAVFAAISALDPVSGYKTKHLYNVQAAMLFTQLPDPHLPQDDPRQRPYDFMDPPVAGSVMSYWKPPTQWVSSTGVRYWQTHLLAIYMPPPFPHPMHKFKTMGLTLGIDYVIFQPPFDDYKQAHPDTVVLMADRQTGIVQASTILPMVPDWCQVGGPPGSFVPQGCALRLTNLSQAVQSGFRKSGEEPFGSFMKAELDGEDYFIRRVDLGFQNLELVWMRPTSSVQGKVQEALVLLILFTALVLCFDVTIMVMEVIFIAMPMRQLSSAIMSVGDMETEAARGAVERYETRCAMLSEMRALTAGMMKTVLRLEQFRTFIPDALVGVVDDDTESSEAPSVRTRSVTRTTRSDSASKASKVSHSTQQQAAAARQSLDLHIHSRAVGLLYVNAVNWWQESCAQDDKGRQLLDRHTSLATAVLGVVSSHNGTLDSFSGDRFLVGWNTAKAKGDYAVCAADTAWALQGTVKGVRLSCAVVCGRAWVGNTGTQTVRRFSVMTPLVPWVMKLEAFAKWRNYTCVTDDATALRLEHSYACQVVDALVCRRRKAAIPVLHLLGQIDMATAEWMYQLEESEKKNKKTTQLNGIACAIMNSQWDTARELAGNGNVVDDLPEPLAQSLNHEVFTPLQMCFERNPNDPSLRDLVIGTSKPVR